VHAGRAVGPQQHGAVGLPVAQQPVGGGRVRGGGDLEGARPLLGQPRGERLGGRGGAGDHQGQVAGCEPGRGPGEGRHHQRLHGDHHDATPRVRSSGPGWSSTRPSLRTSLVPERFIAAPRGLPDRYWHARAVPGLGRHPEVPFGGGVLRVRRGWLGAERSRGEQRRALDGGQAWVGWAAIAGRCGLSWPRCGLVLWRLTRARCQRSRVSGVMRRWCRRCLDRCLVKAVRRAGLVRWDVVW
jgi:hypothetical protein